MVAALKGFGWRGRMTSIPRLEGLHGRLGIKRYFGECHGDGASVLWWAVLLRSLATIRRRDLK